MIKMKNSKILSLTLALISAVALGFTACGGDDDDRDMTPPVISDEGITANPVNCQVYHRGEVIAFHYIFSDNQELGNYTIEIHSNFDHHSHSTEGDHDGENECDDDHDGGGHHDGDVDDHNEGQAWNKTFSFTIPSGLTRFEARQDLQIPADAKPGDYHFMIRLTDRAGWQQLTAVAIKIEE